MASAISGKHDDLRKHLTSSGHATPRTAARPGTSLEEFEEDDREVIAIDLDDVLSQTNQVVADWHNDRYGTNMTLDDFYYYYYWMNPYWGTPDEAVRKVEEFWLEDYLDRALPIEGAYEGLVALKNLGYRLVLVTARQQRELERSLTWLETHYPGMFDTMICTGQSQETVTDSQKTDAQDTADAQELVTKLSKADVCKRLGARLMIDDSVENAYKCVISVPPVPVLLFGDYSWNKRFARYDDISKELSFAEKLKREDGREFWKEERADVEFPADQPWVRVNNWREVVEWVEKEKAGGLLQYCERIDINRDGHGKPDFTSVARL